MFPINKLRRIATYSVATGLLFSSLILSSCSSTATLNKVQTTTNYNKKSKLKVLAYVPPDFNNRIIRLSPGSQTCSNYSIEISTANGYFSTVESGLSAAFEKVELSKDIVSADRAQELGYDLMVNVRLNNENQSVTVNPTMFSNTINTQFQVSFGITVSDTKGTNITSFTANGSGFNNETGGCGDMANILSKSMESALRQVADYIAQSAHSNADIRDFEQSISSRAPRK